jgi:MFS family permease
MLPLFSSHLETLSFSHLEIGFVSATQALGTILGPILAGQVADRWLPAERCLSIGGVCTGVLLLILTQLTSPSALFVLTVILWMFMAAGLSLCASVSFSHLADPEREFGAVRLCGTIGWVVPQILMACWLANPEWLCRCVAVLRPDHPTSHLVDTFRLGAVAAFLTAAYAWTLPATPPVRHGTSWLAPLAALHLLRSRNFAVYLGCNYLAYIIMPFATQLTPLFLRRLGLSDSELALSLPLSQMTEILSLALLPMILLRLGLPGTLIFGLAAMLGSMTILTIGRPVGLVLGSMMLNGLFVTCFLVAGQLFVNSRASGEIRASVQGLLSITTGLGLLNGHVLIGVLRWANAGDFAPTFGTAAGMALVLVVLFAVGFRERTRREVLPEEVSESGIVAKIEDPERVRIV